MSHSLSVVKVSAEHPGPLPQITNLVLKGRQFETVEDLSILKGLRKLDLSDNQIADIEGLSMNLSLKCLFLSQNRISRIHGLANLENLTVLNLSHNQITKMEGLAGLTQLQALILNNNAIVRIEGLTHLTNLNTLVLSHNRIEKVSGIEKLKALKKLSLAHNKIQTLPSLAANFDIVELRLNDNLLTTVPETLKYNGKLRILDLGRNAIKQITDLDPLATLLLVENVNLSGNPACSLEEYSSRIKQIVPHVKILDGKRLSNGAAPATSSSDSKKTRLNPDQTKGPKKGAKTKEPSAVTVTPNGRKFEGKRVEFDAVEEEENNGPKTNNGSRPVVAAAAVSTVGQKRPASSTENRFDAFLAEKKHKEQEEEALKKRKLEQKKQKKKKQKQTRTGEQQTSTVDNGSTNPDHDETENATVDSSRSGVMAVTVNRHKKRKLATPATNDLTVAELIRQTAPVELLGGGGASGWDD